MKNKTARQPIPKDADPLPSTPSVGRKVADQERFYVLELPLSDWLAFADHPRHRDVERHAKKAHWEFARRADGPMVATLCSVSAADLNGQLFKVDGHTRSYLWATNRLNPPATVMATVYRCRTPAELHALYNMFDSQFAVEERYESVLAAYRAHNLTLTSARLREGMVVDALYIAVTGVARSNQKTGDASNELDMFKAIGYFRDELQLLDSVNPRGEVFHGGVVAAALLGLAIRPTGIRFFEELAKDGRRGGFATEAGPNGKRDPVAALLQWLWELKQSKSAWVKRSQEDLCARTLHALFKFLQGPESEDYWFEDVPAPEDIAPIIQTVRHLKGIDEPTLAS
jgi:hypothetical protein